VKILIAIDAPALKAGWGREQQWVLTGISSMLRLLATRIEFAQGEGSIHGDAGATLRWKIEQATPAPAEGEAA
jgi:hypothetical protein